MKFIIYLITILSFTIYSGHDISKLSNPDFKKIDSLFKDFDKKDSPGYAIGILKGTEILYTEGYGSANLDYGISITTNSSFDIA